MKNNTWTIVRKEFARFFGDRSLVFTTIIMPGLLIYLIYSLMGDVMTDSFMGATDEPTVVYVENAPDMFVPCMDSLPFVWCTSDFQPDEILAKLGDSESNLLYVAFPPQFDSLVASYSPLSGLPAPNVRIFYNSSNSNSNFAYTTLSVWLEDWENSLCNKFDINASEGNDSEESFDCASTDDIFSDIFGNLIPMLLLILLFSGCMAVASTSIAGEKERGTIATLLVTPMKRSQLALGKIFALSCIAILSGLSSFLGIMLSLPKMIPMDEVGIAAPGYATSDYMLLLLIILSTTLLLVTLISIISAFAKTVKSATTMVSPLMFLIMLVGLSPMLMNGTDLSLATFAIPIFNSVQAMNEVFSYKVDLLSMLITVFSNIAYTAIGVFVLTKLFSSEKVMFGK